MPLNDIPREKEYKLFSVEGRKEGTFVIYRNEATKDIREIKNESAEEILERINKDILAIKNEIENEEKLASIDPVVDFSNTRP